jgi:hypothetical protein
MRPLLGRGDADSHLWPCPQCGSANGLNAHACWNCEAELRTPSAEELPPPIAASLEKRGILERAAQWQDSHQPEMAFATEGAETDAVDDRRSTERAGGTDKGPESAQEDRSTARWDAEGWSTVPPELERWSTASSKPKSASTASSELDSGSAALPEPERASTASSEPERGSAASSELDSGSAASSDSESGWTAASQLVSGSPPPSHFESASTPLPQPESGPNAPWAPEVQSSSAPPQFESESTGSSQSEKATAPPSADPSSDAEIDNAEIYGAAERPRERPMSAHDRSVEAFLALWNQSGAEPPGAEADKPTARPPIEPAAESLAARGAFGGPGAAIERRPFEHSRPDSAPEPDSAQRQPSGDPGVDVAAEHPPIETFEGSAVAAHEHPPIRTGDDEPAVGPQGIEFGPTEPPILRHAAVDAFGPLPSARQEIDPFHDVALGEKFAELAQASARNARRRRRITLAAGGVLVAVMIAVAYPTFRSGVRIDLSSQELQSAAAARPDAARTPAAVDQTPAPATASTPGTTAPAAEGPATPRAAPPVPAAARAADRADQPAVVTAPPAAPPATNRASRTPPREVLERFERVQPSTARPARDAVGAPNEPVGTEAAASPPPGAARAGSNDATRTDNSSITCTERILALGLCGPEPSSRKE